jgi:hypothetical protein
MKEKVFTREDFRRWGREGGRIGGKVRMAKLTPEERLKLSRKANRAKKRAARKKDDTDREEE